MTKSKEQGKKLIGQTVKNWAVFFYFVICNMASSARQREVELNSDRYELQTKLNKAILQYKTSQNVAQAARGAGVSEKQVRGNMIFSQKFSLLLYNFS